MAKKKKNVAPVVDKDELVEAIRDLLCEIEEKLDELEALPCAPEEEE